MDNYFLKNCHLPGPSFIGRFTLMRQTAIGWLLKSNICCKLGAVLCFDREPVSHLEKWRFFSETDDNQFESMKGPGGNANSITPEISMVHNAGRINHSIDTKASTGKVAGHRCSRKK
jgi:hypothetical protein